GNHFGLGVTAPGMPYWRVAEPYLALWLHDTPMLYRTAKGTEVTFRVAYNADEQRPDDTNVFNLGPYSNCNWLSYIDLGDPDDPTDPLFTHYSATNYGAGGGQRLYDYFSPVINYGNNTTFEKLDDGSKVTGAKIHYPNGSVWTYGLVVHL